jgi:conjugal transfer pilus assembly protein TrbC
MRTSRHPSRGSFVRLLLALGLLVAVAAVVGFHKKAHAQSKALTQIQTQSQALPSDDVLQKAQEAAQRASSRAIDKATAQRATSPGMPIFETPAPSGVDPEEVMRQYLAIKKGGGETKSGAEEGFIVFISLSMPPASLDRLIDQSIAMKFTLVLRGMSGQSLTDTIKTVQALVGQREADIQIDPRLFTRFGINRVPAVALVSPDTGKSGVVYGDVSVDYALEHMVNAMPGVAKYAKTLLKAARP